MAHKEIYELFEKETNKKAIWKGKETIAFKQWSQKKESKPQNNSKERTSFKINDETCEIETSSHVILVDKISPSKYSVLSTMKGTGQVQDGSFRSVPKLRQHLTGYNMNTKQANKVIEIASYIFEKKDEK